MPTVVAAPVQGVERELVQGLVVEVVPVVSLLFSSHHHQWDDHLLVRINLLSTYQHKNLLEKNNQLFHPLRSHHPTPLLDADSSSVSSWCLI